MATSRDASVKEFTRERAVRRHGRLARAAFAVGMAAGLAATATPGAGAEPSARVEPPVGRTAFAVPLSGITVDGQLDDWPDDMDVYTPRENTDVYGSTDLSGTDLDTSTDFSPSFRVGYSVEAQKIYVAMEHRDDRVHVARRNVRATDAGEINLAGLLHVPPWCYSLVPPGGGYFEAGNPAVYQRHLDDEKSAESVGTRAVFGRHGDVSVYEWALTALGESAAEPVELRPGRILSFDVVAVDNDGPGDTSAWIAWTPNRAKHQPPNVGRLILAAGPLGTLRVEARGGGAPLEGARYEVWQGDRLVLADVTGARGLARQPLPPGSYTVRLNTNGYRAFTEGVHIDSGEISAVSAALQDLGTRFHVDDDASPGGDGSAQRPFTTIQQSLAATSYGDTVQLAPGTYANPVELISGVTFVGAGHDETLVTGEAAWGMALRPFIAYFSRPGAPPGGWWRIALRDVFMEGFRIDAGERYPVRAAGQVAGSLNMMMAVDRDDPGAVAALLQADASLASARIHSPDAPVHGSTFLHRVVTVYTDASDAEHEIARLLIEHGADVNARGGQARGQGRTALGYAGFFGNPRLVELYLAHGGVADAEVMHGTALEGSQERNKESYIPAFEMLIEAGGPYDLAHLVMLGHVERLMAELDEDPERLHETSPLIRDQGTTGAPLNHAADGCETGIAMALLDRGADVNGRDSKGRTPLQRALDEGCGEDFVGLLLERGAEMDFISAVMTGDVERVRAILSEDPARIRQLRWDGRSALDIAADQERDELESVLRAAGGAFNQRVQSMLAEADPSHGVHGVLSQVTATRGHPGYMHLEPSASLDIRGQITLATWLYRVDDGGGGTVIGKWRQVDETWSYVLHLPRGGFSLRWEDGSQTALRGYWLPYHEWVHYAATYDGAHMRVFVNGELAAEEPVAGKRINSTSNPVWIGASGYHDHTAALIDDAQIWNVARTPEQIRQSMREGLRGDEPGLVGWWPMDGPAPLADRSPHGNHGRLEGSAAVHAAGLPADGRHAPAQVLWLLPLAEAPTDEHTAYAIPLDDITIDGRLDDWPEEMAAYPIDRVSEYYKPEPPEGPEDLTANFHVGYDAAESLLYLAIVVRDEDVVVLPDRPSYNTQDLCEIHVDSRPRSRDRRAFARYAMVPGLGRFAPRARGNPAFLDGLPRFAGVRAAYSNRGRVTVYEWAIPVQPGFPHSGPIETGMKIGFEVVVSDADGRGLGNWVTWTPRESGASQSDLIFVDSYDGLNVRVSQVVDESLYGNLGLVSGRVTDAGTGRPVVDAQVEIRQPGRPALLAFTGADGRYERSVDVGRYSVAATARGARASAARDVRVRQDGRSTVDLSIEDPGTRFHVDDDAGPDGDGSAARPFAAIQQALNATSPGDTVQVAPGVYGQPLELVSSVTVLGAGAERTRLVDEAAWWLGLRPFITYHERRGSPGGLGRVSLRDVAMAGFTVDAGEEYPLRPAEEVADVLAMVMAIDRDDAAAVAALLEGDPDLARRRIYSPDAYREGSTFLHRVVTVYRSATDEEHEIARLLIEHGADVNARGGQARGSGRTATGYAGFFGNARLVELYLAHGGVADDEVMHGTAREGSQERDKATYIPAFEMLIQAGGPYDLAHLVMLGHGERLLAELDEDPRRLHETSPLIWDRGTTGAPLNHAADGCETEIAMALLDRGADVNGRDSKGWTPLQRALDEGCGDDFIGLLLDRGAEVGFISAVMTGDVDRVRAILSDDPASIRQLRWDGRSALDIAVDQERTGLESVLRDAGGTFNQRVQSMLDEAGPRHGVHGVLSQVTATRGHPGYLHLEPTASLDIRDQITLAAWLYRVDDGGGAGTVIGKWRQVDETWSYVLHLPRGGFRLRWEDGSQTALRGYWLPYHEWVHYAATYDGAHMRVFVNGELAAEELVAGKRINSTANPVWIGASGYRDHTAALIDDVQIWNVARTPEQIRQSMREGLRGDEPGLVGWWPMDGADPLADRSPHGNHGRLEGSAAVHPAGIPADERHAPAQVLWLLPLAEGAAAR